MVITDKMGLVGQIPEETARQDGLTVQRIVDI